MYDLIVILVRAADPIAFIILLAALAIFFTKKAIIPAAIVVALGVETLTAQMNPTHSWGDKIIHGIIASLIQAFIAFYIVKFFKSRKKSAKRD